MCFTVDLQQDNVSEKIVFKSIIHIYETYWTRFWLFHSYRISNGTANVENIKLVKLLSELLHIILWLLTVEKSWNILTFNPVVRIFLYSAETHFTLLRNSHFPWRFLSTFSLRFHWWTWNHNAGRSYSFAECLTMKLK